VTGVTYADLVTQAGAGVVDGALAVRRRPFDSADDVRTAIADYHGVLDAIEAHVWQLIEPAHVAGVNRRSQPDPVEAGAVAMVSGLRDLVGAERPHPAVFDRTERPWSRAAMSLRAASDLLTVHLGPYGQARSPDAKALNDAVRRRRLPRNPVTLAHTPRYDAPDIEPLTVTEARALLAAADDEPNGAAFMLAISLGLRRGEVLGLSWDDVDLDAGHLSVRRQLERRDWKHGCADPDRCDDRPSRCPQRNGGGLVLAELKTKGSRRTLPLPPPLIAALRTHRQRQRAARIHAGTVWANSGMVFTTVTGRPVAPHDHSLHWTAFLEGAGVRPARLHDARHTAATFLLVQGVDQRVVMSMFGWTSTTMTARYQHVVPELVEEANRRMSDLLWGHERSHHSPLSAMLEASTRP